jgi:uncharacterized protein with GYD domain
MVRFASLFNFTEQGLRKYPDTLSRADSFIKDAAKSGVKVTGLYWLVGAYDGLVLMEAPDEQAVTAVLLKLAALGNVHTQTMRAYDRAEMEGIIGKAK